MQAAGADFLLGGSGRRWRQKIPESLKSNGGLFQLRKDLAAEGIQPMMECGAGW